MAPAYFPLALLNLVLVGLAFASQCQDRYGGTCLRNIRNCPNGNYAAYNQCNNNQVCCFGPKPVNVRTTTTRPPATTVQSGNAPTHYLCQDVYGGTCLQNLKSCPTGNHATYGQCDGGHVCCFGPNPINAAAQTAATTRKPAATTVQSGNAPTHYLCQDVYGGTCLQNLKSCPTGNHATYGQCDGGHVCCFGPYPVNGNAATTKPTTKATTTTTTTTRRPTAKPTSGSSSSSASSICGAIYGGTCLVDILACPTGNHGSYGQCSGQQICCFGPNAVQGGGGGNPTAATTAAPAAHTMCGDLFGGTCLPDAKNCPAGNHITVSFCGFRESCCFGPHAVGGSSGGGSSSGQTTSKPATTAPPSGGTCGVSLVNSNARIVGGQEALSHEFPWQVSLLYNGHHMCGGTLIDDQWVLSAAHCFENTYLDQWRVAVGVHDKQLIYQRNYLQVQHVYRHANFDTRGSNDNDIALLKLQRPIDITGRDVRSACLPSRNENFDNQMCVVTGWGSSYEDGDTQRYLQKVSMPVLRNDLCNYWMGRNVVTSSMMCAGFRQGGKDACQGDSGGPLVCKTNGVWKLAGIVSWGYGCGNQYSPGIYTRVSSFLDWIDNAKRQS